MTTAAAAQPVTQFKGLFADTTKLSAFIQPLKELAFVMDDTGVVLNISKTDENVVIRAQNTAKGILAYITYKKELFAGFEFGSDEKIGIHRLADFMKFLSVMEEPGVQVEFQNTCFSISHADHGVMSVKTAEPSMIQEAPASFKGTTWFADVIFDTKFAKLKKAMTALSSEDSVSVVGNSTKNKLTFTVRGSSAELNTYKVEVPVTIKNDFETIYRKDVLQVVLSSANVFTASFGEKLVRLQSSSEYSDATYYIAKKSKAA